MVHKQKVQTIVRRVCTYVCSVKQPVQKHHMRVDDPLNQLFQIKQTLIVTLSRCTACGHTVYSMMQYTYITTEKHC